MLNVLFLGFIVTVVAITGDIFIKKASLMSGFTGYKSLLIGALLYGSTALGWFFWMRRAKLSTIGTVFSIFSVILMTLVSVFYFKEKINTVEIIGICLAIVSLLILSRFS